MHTAKSTIKVGGLIITVTNDGDFNAAEVTILMQVASQLYNRVVVVARSDAPLPDNDASIWYIANGRFERRREELPTSEVVSVWSHDIPLVMYTHTSSIAAIETLRGALAAQTVLGGSRAPMPDTPTQESAPTSYGGASVESLFSATVLPEKGVIQVVRNKAVHSIDIAQRYDYKNIDWMLEGREYAYPVTLIKRHESGRIMLGMANDMGIFSVFPPKALPDGKVIEDKVYKAADALLGPDAVLTVDNVWLSIKRKGQYTNAVQIYSGNLPHAAAPAAPQPAPQGQPSAVAQSLGLDDSPSYAVPAPGTDNIPF